MTKADELLVRIENATKEVEEDYQRTLKTVARLKEEMNELEQRISKKKHEEADADINSLRSATDSLNRLTDSQILRSKTAWKKFEGLKHDCKTQTLELPQLDEMQKLYKKTEQLAADLLCYSLGLSKPKNP